MKAKGNDFLLIRVTLDAFLYSHTKIKVNVRKHVPFTRYYFVNEWYTDIFNYEMSENTYPMNPEWREWRVLTGRTSLFNLCMNVFYDRLYIVIGNRKLINFIYFSTKVVTTPPLYGQAKMTFNLCTCGCKVYEQFDQIKRDIVNRLIQSYIAASNFLSVRLD